MTRYRWEEYPETQADGTVVMKWRQVVEQMPLPEPRRNPNLTDEERARRRAIAQAAIGSLDDEQADRLRAEIQKIRSEWPD